MVYTQPMPFQGPKQYTSLHSAEPNPEQFSVHDFMVHNQKCHFTLEHGPHCFAVYIIAQSGTIQYTKLHGTQPNHVNKQVSHKSII